jgi:valyl-tRNA synthetase
MSKSKGNVVTPMHLLDDYTSDGVRYWAANAKLGADTAFDQKVLKIGRRLVTKLYNAGKFVLSQTGEMHPITSELDRAFVHHLRGLIQKATDSYDRFEYAHALAAVESFFWSTFTDTYLELVKARARGDGAQGEAGRGSAVASLRLGLNVLLRLFAPVLPYITEEVWSWAFAEETGHQTIHKAPWPRAEELEGIEQPTDAECFERAVACWTAINKSKSEAGASVARRAIKLVVAANDATAASVEAVEDDVMLASRCSDYTLKRNSELEDGVFEVLEAILDEKEK